MPVPMRNALHKAEAKYNVTTEFPSLGLHSAAATGNVGLVEYALNNGQPINSVLDGVLPLHAACAGGNVQVVKALIEHGADVNAPRLPRKYSNDKNRDTSAPIVGTSGSTPLHFAAANGNAEVIHLLLLHGAHPDRPDKHGVTPESLALQNGWVECAQILREWTLNKDRDLREREGHVGTSGPSYPESSSVASRRRLHVKQSIDTALNMLKTPDSSARAGQSLYTPPTSPLKAFGEYAFYPSNNVPVELGSRRPSLPHVLQPPSESVPRNRKPSNSTPEKTSQRRPRSAGNGADRNEEQEQTHPVYGRGGSGRKLGSKYSLLNIFKKGQSGDGMEPPAANMPENGSNWELSGSPSPRIMGQTSNSPLPTPPNHSGQASNIDLSEPSPGTPPSGSISRLVSRVHRGSDASTKGSRLVPQSQHGLPRRPSGTLQNPSRANPPLAVELHMALAQQQQRIPTSNLPPDEGDKFSGPLGKISSSHNRNRSGSSISMPVENSGLQETLFSESENANGKPSPSPRPGILRAHNRTPSTGQGSPINPRTLRFDSSSSIPTSERRGLESLHSSPAVLRSYNSAGSLTKLHIQTNVDNGADISDVSPAKENVLDDDGDGDQDENYGQPIEEGHAIPSVLLQRQRGESFASSSESSLSPILTSNDNASGQSMTVLKADFPFSINRPPALLTEEPADDLSLSLDHLNVPVLSDTRNRGDSLSSNSTSDSRSNAPLTSSNTSGSGTNVTIASPKLHDDSGLPHTSHETYVQIPVQTQNLDKTSSPPISIPGLNERRAHIPLDIDITSISSHAQAEALVERARQEVLDFANAQDGSPSPAGVGRTPLSARLAAYGESLALERRLREQKEEEALKDNGHKPMSGDLSSDASKQPVLSLPPLSQQKSREGVERQLSLENKTTSPRHRKRPRDPRRPSTADGLSSSKDSFFAERSPSHQPSQSTSTSSPSHLSPLSSKDRSKPLPSPRMNTIPIVDSDRNDYSMQAARARTPVVPDEPLSRTNSIDGIDTETDSVPTVHRIPASVPSNSRGKREQVRSAKKLTKMGIPVAEQAAAASRASPAPLVGSPPPHKRSFGIKSIMQSFKGKA